MSTLYIMTGVPGSGKTTFATRWFSHNKNIKYVSRDGIRFNLLKDGESYFSREKEVWELFVSFIQLGLDEGFDVIADATHINKGSRFKLYSALNMKRHKAGAVVIPATLETCVAHNNARKGTKFYVPYDAIEKMHHKFTYPDLENEPYLDFIYNVSQDGYVTKIVR